MYIPDGHVVGKPTVAVCNGIVEQIGDVKTDYDALEELFYGDFQVSRSVIPHCILTEDVPFNNCGVFNPSRPSEIKINPIVSSVNGIYGLTEVLLHEGQHLADFNANVMKWRTYHRARLVGNLASAGSAGFSAYEVSPDLAIGLAAGITTALTTVAVAQSMWRKSHLIQKLEQRADKTESTLDLVIKYSNSITFPEALITHRGLRRAVSPSN